MRKIIIITASLFALTAAEAQDAAKPDWWPSSIDQGPRVEVTTAFEVWRACVDAKADRFSRGSDSADLILQAALTACKEERIRALRQIDKTKNDGPTKFASDWVLSWMEAVIKEEALLRVIELRAAK